MIFLLAPLILFRAPALVVVPPLSHMTHQTPSQKDGPQTVIIPEIGPGSNQSFLRLVEKIRSELSQSQFEGAKATAAFLPGRVLNIRYDDSKVPSALRADYFAAMQDALRTWQGGLPVRIQFFSTTDPLYSQQGLKPNLTIEFEDHLAAAENANEPLSVALFNHGSAKPYEIIVGLKRGAPLKPTTPNELDNAIKYGISQYFGLQPNPNPAAFAHLVNGPDDGTHIGIPAEKVIVDHNLEAVDALNQAIDQKQVVAGIAPRLSLDPNQIKVMSGVIQGDQLSIVLQMTNIGTGRLHTMLIPDCSCFSSSAPIDLASGQTGLYKVMMDTSSYGAEVHKELFLYTNDPELPYFAVPVDVNVVRRYQFVTRKSQTQTVGPTNFEITNLILDQKSDRIIEDLVFYGPAVRPLGWTVQPANFKVKKEDWEGEVTDGGKKKTVKGSRFIITPPPGFKNQRVPVTLNISTDDPVFRAVTNTVYVQNGIVATPSEAFLGPVGNSFTTFTINVAWPGRTFKVLGAKLNLPQFEVKTTGSGAGSSHDIILRYLHKPGSGPFSATLRIKTNIPGQTEIRVPISGRFLGD